MSRSFLAVSASVLALVGGARPALSQSVALPTLYASSSESASAGWAPSSLSFGSIECVGCGVPFVPDTYYGAQVNFTTQGSVGVNANTSASTGALNVQMNSNAALSILQNAVTKNYNFSYTPDTAQPTFTQTGATLSAGVGASINFSNSVSGQVCVVECGSFSTSLGSVNTSFTALGYNTAGSGSVTVLGASVSGADGQSHTFTSGSTQLGTVSLQAPNNFVSSSTLGTEFGDTRANVLSASINLTNIGTLLADLPALNGSYGNRYLSAGYNLLTASLNLSTSLYQSTFMSQSFSTNPDIEFFDKSGNRISLTFNVPGAGNVPLTEINFSDVLDNGFTLVNSSLKIGDYAEMLTPYTLSVEQQLDATYSGALAITALGVSFDGDQYNAVSKNYPIFSYGESLLDAKTTYSGVLTSNFSFPAFSSGVPEPATWAMMLAGFGFTGVALRRRRLVVMAA